MSSDLDQFDQRSRQFYEALGDRFPAWGDRVREQADRALRGEICQSPDGEWARVGLTDIDWACLDTYNPPQVEMALRRYVMLGPLVAGWRATRGARIINDALRRQVLADGAHMETTPGYHGVVLDVFENSWRLARALPELELDPK